MRKIWSTIKEIKRKITDVVVTIFHSIKVLVMLALILLNVFGALLGKEEEDPEDLVMRALSEKYGEGFYVVGQKSGDNTHALVVSPKRDSSIVFWVGQGVGSRGESSEEEIRAIDNYIFQSYLYYLPEIYGKHLGTTVNRDELLEEYEDLLNEGTPRDPWLIHSDDFLSNDALLIKDLNEDNASEKARIIHGILKDYLEKEPFNRFSEWYEKDESVKYCCDVEIPYTIKDRPFNIYNTISIWEVIINPETAEEEIYQQIMKTIQKS